MVRIEI